MSNLNDTPTSSNNDTDSNDLSDDDEVNSPTHQPEALTEQAAAVTTNGTGANLLDQILAPEYDPHAPLSNGMIPLRLCGIYIEYYWYWLMFILIGLSFGRSLYWSIVVFIGLGIRIINTILTSGWTYNNRLRVSLGNTQPVPIDYIAGSYQSGPEIAQPSDTLVQLMDTYTFSTTISAPRQESIGYEDTQPHTMPMLPDLNSHTTTNERTSSVTIQHGENTIVGRAPTEILRDTDFSTASTDQRSDEIGTGHDMSMNTITSMHYENHSVGVETGQASSNNEVITDMTQNSTPSYHINIGSNQSSAITSAIDSLSPETSDLERNVDSSTDGGPRAILPDTNPTAIHGPKQPNAIDSPAESSDESVAQKSGVTVFKLFLFKHRILSL